MRIFINERPFDARDGTTVRTAVSEFDPTLAARVADGRAYVTDGVGRKIPDAEPVYAGAIYRVVVSARTRVTEAEGPA